MNLSASLSNYVPHNYPAGVLDSIKQDLCDPFGSYNNDIYRSVVGK